MNSRIRIMLDSREIEELAAEDAEVLGMWRKAARTARTALVRALDDDPDARFTLLYQSALQAATAVVRAAGYRVRGDHNHQITFAAVAALGPGDLSEAARDLNVIRQGRHAAVYDWQATTEAAQLSELQIASAMLLRETHSWLLAQRPSLAAKLIDPAELRGSWRCPVPTAAFRIEKAARRRLCIVREAAMVSAMVWVRFPAELVLSDVGMM